MSKSQPLPLTREDLDVLEFIAKRLRADDEQRSGMVARARAYQMQDDDDLNMHRAYERIAELEAICLPIRNVESGEEQLDPTYTEKQRAAARTELDALVAKLSVCAAFAPSATPDGIGK